MYKRNVKGWAKHLDFIVWDMACLIAAFFVGYWGRNGFTNPLNSSAYRELLMAVLFWNFFLLLLLDTMKNVLKRGHYQEARATFFQALALLLCLNAYLFATKTGADVSRLMIYLMIVYYGLITYLVRFLYKKHLRARLQSIGTNSLIIMADAEHCVSLIREINTHDLGMHRIAGLVTVKPEYVGSEIAGVPVVACNDTVVEYVTNHWVDEILLHVPVDKPFPQDIADVLISMGVTVHVNMDRSVLHLSGRQTVGNMGDLLVVSNTMNYMTPRQHVAKRLLDIAGGLVGCLLTGILCLFLAPAIKKESPGPLFFSQERIGRNGKPFKCYKFRSMYMDAEERKKELMAQNRIESGLMFKMEFDPRVIGNRIDADGTRHTGIGEFIRKYSLDEFPQFFNVLKGDMSLVGTRPPVRSEYEAYDAHHKARLAAKPGITGMWQVSGRSEILDFEEVVRLDTEYINNWSLGLDIRIILRTIKVVLKKEGAM